MQGTGKEDFVEIDLQEIIRLVLRRLWLIALCGLSAGAIGFAVSSYVIAPQYESTTKVYILNKQDSSTVTYSDTQLATQLTKDYNELIISRYVLEKVIEECGLTDTYGEMQDRIFIENKADTRIIGITVQDTEPVRAQYIADTVRDVASEHITAVMDIEAVNIVETANLPDMPSEPSVSRWSIVGTLAGLFVSMAVIIIHYLMDDTIRSPEDIENYLGLSTLALIPDTGVEGKKGKRKKVRSSQEYTSYMNAGHSKAVLSGNRKDSKIREIDIDQAEVKEITELTDV